MSKCIFCLSESNGFSREEHFVPESLGGDEVLPAGLVCDQCNEYFGREVEGPALNNPTLLFLRSTLSIPNKKGKQRHYKGYNFDIYGQKGAEPIFVPSSQRLQAMQRLGRGQIRIPIGPLGSITRLMLKMGLEAVALSQECDVFDDCFNEARKAVRTPQRSTTWWMAYGRLQLEDVIEEGIDKEGHFVKESVYHYTLYRASDIKTLLFYFSYSWACYIIPLIDKDITELIDNLNEINKPNYAMTLKCVTLLES